MLGADPARSRSPAPCGLDLSGAAFRSAEDWDRAYEARWGELGVQTRAQIDHVLHNVGGRYDDAGAEFAWIVHYWVRAWLAMADLTGDTKYLDACVSFIDYMFEHTDARRVARGEMTEKYVRDPLYLRGTGRGGPFWKRDDRADVLNTGQIVRAIMYFVDAVFSDPMRWHAYQGTAKSYFAEAVVAADAFDNDWQVFGDKGSYHYRDSSGTGMLGTTRTAFNQSATMVEAQFVIARWRPQEKRFDKVQRLTRYWLEDFATFRPDGTVVWKYMLHPEHGVIEDAGHATIDVDFLVAAHLSGVAGLKEAHMKALARTFLHNVHDGRAGLNEFVDGTSSQGYSEHYNAGFGWLELARYEPEILDVALRIFSAHYPPDAAEGVLWARPMLGWANLLRAARGCPS